jgi:hypothetical protein
MEYVGSMVDPKNTHEYDWNEYLLDLAMKEVMKIQKKGDTIGSRGRLQSI